MPLRYCPFITSEMVEGAPEVLFVFGDNLAGFGNGGQAVIRGYTNAVGIPTKRAPRTDAAAFFTDDDLGEFQFAASVPLRRLRAHLETGGIVLWPSDGVGTGRAELPTRAPKLWAALERARVRLEGIDPE